MRQAKNNSIMHKIQLKWTIKKASIIFIKVAKQQIIIKKNIRLRALIPDNDNEEVNFLYENNLPKDQRSVAGFAAKLWFTI